jgi:DNA-binding transcriptional MerR regulator
MKKESNDDLLGPSASGRLCGVAAATIVSWERKGLLSAMKTTDGHRIFRRGDVLKAQREVARIKAKRERDR